MRALIFDLDGTLVDTVYAHVFAWQLTLAEAGHAITPEQTRFLQDRHGEHFRTLMPARRPLPGAVALLRRLRQAGIPHGIATSGRRPDIDASLAALELPPEAVVVDRQDVPHAKPAPDLFLACSERLGVGADECYVV